MENIKNNTNITINTDSANNANSTSNANSANNASGTSKQNRKNNTLNNENFGYTIYMMVGSNFEKASCKNPFLEKRLRAQYWELKEDKQLQMEDAVLLYMENVLSKEIPESFWRTSVKVRFTTGGEQEEAKVWFFTGKEILCVEGKFRGKNSTLSHQVYGKRKLA